VLRGSAHVHTGGGAVLRGEKGAAKRRLDADENVAELAEDYKLTPAEIEEAALFERAA